MPFKYTSLQARLLAMSKEQRLHDYDPTKPWTLKPCRIWSGQVGGSRGYGRMTFRSRYRYKYGKNKGQRKTKTYAAHRVSLALALGIPVWRLNHALHLCDNPPCIEETHLWSSTQLTNVRDCVAKGRHRNMYSGPLEQERPRRASRAAPR